MRKIKFRAFDKIEGKMWIPIIDQDGMPCAKHPISCHLVRMDGELLDPVMQYTGLKDKNGKEIYEGDILASDKLHGAHVSVQFDHHLASWMLRTRIAEDYYGINFYNKDEHQIIGNIYENPELLGE